MKSVPISKCVRWVTLRNCQFGCFSSSLISLFSEGDYSDWSDVFTICQQRAPLQKSSCCELWPNLRNKTPCICCSVFLMEEKSPFKCVILNKQITRRHLVCVWCFFFISFSAVKNLHPYKQVLNSNAEQEYVLNTLLMWRKWLLQTSTRTREIMEQQKKQQPNTDKPVKWIQ